jgi:deoxycytidine triphosphate deaminase
MKDGCLLSDSEVQNLSTDTILNKLIDPFCLESASGGSYILRVGTIHKPIPENPVIEVAGRNSWTITPGQMAVIVTYEKVHIPDNLIGIVFGTNGMMMKGLLIVNPGIITSGHNREITFYAINFSKTNLFLTEGEPISRIIFLRSEKNVVNPRNLTTDARLDAAIVARERFYSDFEGYFHSLVAPRISTYVREIVGGLVLGTIVFAALISIISVLSPIIAERVQKVPQIQQEIAELKTELSALKSEKTSLLNYKNQQSFHSISNFEPNAPEESR